MTIEILILVGLAWLVLWLAAGYFIGRLHEQKLEDGRALFKVAAPGLGALPPVHQAGPEHRWHQPPVHKDGSKWDTYTCVDCGQSRTVLTGVEP